MTLDMYCVMCTYIMYYVMCTYIMYHTLYYMQHIKIYERMTQLADNTHTKTIDLLYNKA
jgi:hypothetical protein